MERAGFQNLNKSKKTIPKVKDNPKSQSKRVYLPRSDLFLLFILYSTFVRLFFRRFLTCSFLSCFLMLTFLFDFFVDVSSTFFWLFRVVVYMIVFWLWLLLCFWHFFWLLLNQGFWPYNMKYFLKYICYKLCWILSQQLLNKQWWREDYLKAGNQAGKSCNVARNLPLIMKYCRYVGICLRLAQTLYNNSDGF